MKTRLGTERLEDRRTLSSWSVSVLDPQNLVSPQVEDQMKAAGHYIMWTLDRQVSWKGTLDMAIDIRPPHPDYDGFTPAILQVMPGGRNATIYEMQTGIDPMPNSPDLGMIVFMGRDGTVKLYGMKAYFDPDPGPYVPANVPAGYFDFIGVLTHESFHGLAFQGGTTDFNRYVTVDNVGNRFFNGPETVRLLGRSLPLTTQGSTHYGNGRLADNPIRSGLMYEWGNYAGNRLNWGKLDFAVLRDVGITVKNMEGLPLVDTMDSQLPRLVVGTSAIRENMAPGTTVTTVGTTRGSNYTFQILPVMDSASFRLSGTTLVATASFDYELKSVYTIYVRTIDRDGVWTDGKLNIRVLDVFENPVLQIPPSASARGDAAVLGAVRIGGNNETKVTAVFYCVSGVVGYSGRDPEIQVFSTRNSRGGTTMFLVGTTAALNRNFRSVYYLGKDDKISVQIAANGRNWGTGDILLVRA